MATARPSPEALPHLVAGQYAPGVRKPQLRPP
eukprot:CAMPEP_0182542398 /NCGR_PEP_ID=MMETSP1323-20130603/30085_1 /TAXON_ID=236787 /ORGANISM="Florenciella parvula, Strain RCC1693" /LENGTH=31 /DNA_ID= /DNA_START= /DNA_END= /DNA_ORIENTATION=